MLPPQTGPRLKDGAYPDTLASPQVLLLCPPPITNEDFFPDFRNGGIARSQQLSEEFARVSEAMGVPMLDCGQIDGVVCSESDGIHLTLEAHRALGVAVAAKVGEILDSV